MLVKGGKGKRGGRWGGPPMGEATADPNSQSCPNDPPGPQHAPHPTGHPYLDGPKAETIEQGSSEQAAG